MRLWPGFGNPWRLEIDLHPTALTRKSRRRRLLLRSGVSSQSTILHCFVRRKTGTEATTRHGEDTETWTGLRCEEN